MLPLHSQGKACFSSANLWSIGKIKFLEKSVFEEYCRCDYMKLGRGKSPHSRLPRGFIRVAVNQVDPGASELLSCW